MIDLKFPKTKVYNYLKYREAISLNLNHMMKYEKSKEEISSMVNVVYDCFRDKLFAQDMYYFSTLNDLELFLIGTGFYPEELISKAVKHEFDHAKKAEDLGYKARNYSAALLYDHILNEPTFAAQISFDKSTEMSYSDWKQIADAPENPSRLDIIFR